MRSVISAIVKPYLEKNPTAMAALDIIRKHNKASICYDHFAFRTFGVDLCNLFNNYSLVWVIKTQYLLWKHVQYAS